MNRITIEEIVSATGGRLLCSGKEKSISGVKHDSRECGVGDMFVAIKGENTDGHKYIPELIKKGVGVFLVSDVDSFLNVLNLEGGEPSATIICVDDTVYALGELAKYYLTALDLIKIAVTGSVGKTSVRDMTYYVLSERFKCGRNIKNYNNHIGLPLSVLMLDDSFDVAVLEIGMDKLGEIDRLGEIIKPNIAIITNIGVSHIENLGSRDGIFKAKMEIAPHITPKKNGRGTLIFATDDKLTKERTKGEYNQISVGIMAEDDYIISEVDDKGIEGIEFTLGHQGNDYKIALPVAGSHNAINSTLAISAGQLLGVEIEEGERGLMKTELTGRRLRVLQGKNVRVIDDTYNANPSSMKNALSVLDNSICSRKVAILGDMFELGDNAYRLHEEVGSFAAELDLDLLITVGSNAANIAKGAEDKKLQVVHFNRKDDLLVVLDRFIMSGDMILVKGSRGMKMEEITEKLLEY